MKNFCLLIILTICLNATTKTMELSNSFPQENAQEDKEKLRQLENKGTEIGSLLDEPINILNGIGLKKLISSTWIINENDLLKGEHYKLNTPTAQDNKVVIGNRFNKVSNQIAQYVLHNRFIKDYITTHIPLITTKTCIRNFSLNKYKRAYFNDDNTKIIITRYKQKNAQICCAKTGKLIVELEDSAIADYSHKFFWLLQDTRIITIGDWGVLLWDALTGNVLCKTDVSVTAFDFNQKKSTIIVATDNKVEFYDIYTGTLLSSISLKKVTRGLSVNQHLDILAAHFWDEIKFYDFVGNKLQLVSESVIPIENFKSSDNIYFVNNKLMAKDTNLHTLKIYSFHYSASEKTIYFKEELIIFNKKDNYENELEIHTVSINPVNNNLLLITYKYSNLLTIFEIATKQTVQDIYCASENQQVNIRVENCQWSPDGKSILIDYAEYSSSGVATSYSVLCKVSGHQHALYSLGTLSWLKKCTYNGSKLTIFELDSISITILETDPLLNYLENELNLEQALLLLAIEKSQKLDELYALDYESQIIFNTLPPCVEAILQPMVLQPLIKRSFKVWVHILQSVIKRCTSII